MDWFGLASLVASCTAAGGVGWQIWRAEQRSPKYGWRLRVQRREYLSTGVVERTFSARLLGDSQAYEVEVESWGPVEVDWPQDSEPIPHVSCDSGPIEVPFRCVEDKLGEAMIGVTWLDPNHFGYPRRHAERITLDSNWHHALKVSLSPRWVSRAVGRSGSKRWRIRNVASAE